MSDPEVLTRSGAAELLRLHPSAVSRYVRDRGLPGHKIGRYWRFLRSELIEWVRSHEGAPKEKEAA